MTQALRESITKTLGEGGVSFVENGKHPGISLMENATTLMDIEHIRGNVRYFLKLLGIGMNGGNGKEHDGELMAGDTETIIVPGYASRNHTFAFLRKILEEYGIFSNSLNAYEDFRFIAPLSARDAGDMVRQRIEESTAENLRLVGHSMGGIIALLGCQQLRKRDRERIKRIVTLGTPWKGTPMAQLLLMIKRGDKALKDLSPKSELLERHLPKVRGDIREKTVSIGSVADGIVPWQSTVLEGSDLNVILRKRRAVTHANFLHDEHVSKTVAEILMQAG